MFSNEKIKHEALKKIDDVLNSDKEDEVFKGNWKELMGKEVYNHSSRVCDIALSIADEFNLSLQDKLNLAIGCILHDIGKAWINPDILNKTGKYNSDDRALAENHAQMGYRNLSKKRFSREAIDIIHYHHERLDGRGYPDALTEKDGIPVLVQIASVADVYEALTADRVYHKAFLPEDAFKIMRDGANKTGLNQMAVSILREIVANENYKSIEKSARLKVV